MDLPEKRLLLATNNRGKVSEYRSLLRGVPYELVTPADVGIDIEVEESGSSFEENARLKAAALAAASGLGYCYVRNKRHKLRCRHPQIFSRTS